MIELSRKTTDLCQKIECPSCDTKREYYKQMNEFKELSIKDRADISFQQIGMLWGYSWLVIIPLIIGAMFWRQVLDFVRNNKIIIMKKK